MAETAQTTPENTDNAGQQPSEASFESLSPEEQKAREQAQQETESVNPLVGGGEETTELELQTQTASKAPTNQRVVG